MSANSFARFLTTCFFLYALHGPGHAQPDRSYWQQEIKYEMDLDMSVEKNQMSGKQVITYKNNSPDILQRLYFHLYFNAFQPGSSMDIRSLTIPDPDPRIGDRISKLSPDQIGYHKILSIRQSGKAVNFLVDGTILEILPAAPIRPGQKVKLEIEFESQVPLQIRRSGRDNKEGVRFSMAQWYPKMCAYDEHGWHTDPYIGREFYGNWGDFTVNILIDSDYTVAGTGYLKNSAQVGHGYGPEPKTKQPKTKWMFEAKDVHDFVWAADPDYIHETYKCRNGITLRTFYQDHPEHTATWKQLPRIMEEAIDFIEKKVGPYPYTEYAIIQGGDGGMEYPMATLITGHRPLISLVGVSVHEILHSWFQGVLAFNESRFFWMDEGFTNYCELLVMEHLKDKGMVPGLLEDFPYDGDFRQYKTIVNRGIEEPLCTHADHFAYNSAYSFAAYGKGSIYLHQLEYVIGKPVFDQGLRLFYDAWKFKQPDDIDFLRIMEKLSGMELDWYHEYMIHSTHTIDYSIDTVYETHGTTMVHLTNLDRMPMPVDVEVVLSNNTRQYFTIPLNLMRESKKIAAPSGQPYQVLPAWDWVNPFYAMQFPFPVSEIRSVSIDPMRRMADMDRQNNHWPAVPDTLEK